MQSVQSYNTAISRKRASVPLRYLQDKGYLKGTVLDYGCGKGADFNHLRQAGYTAEAYDPHWKPIDLTGKSFDDAHKSQVAENLLDYWYFTSDACKRERAIRNTVPTA